MATKGSDSHWARRRAIRRIRRIRRLSRQSRFMLSLLSTVGPLRHVHATRRLSKRSEDDLSRRLWLAVDGMGGDHAPEAILRGCLEAVQRLPVRLWFCCEPQALDTLWQDEALLQDFERSVSNGLITVVDAGPSVTMADEATAVRRKRKASINMAMDLVNSGRAHGIYSAGNSGAVMASAIFRLGRLEGIDRPAIGALFPTTDPARQVLVLDVGANMDCKATYLHQFALLGSIYSAAILGVDKPRVGLLNIGEEACKGNELSLATYGLLQNELRLDFRGNCEGRDVLSGQFDVVVCDGFTGNVLLKFLESVGKVLLDVLKAELPRGRRGKLGAAFLRGNLRRIKQRLDHAEHGGALLLGVNGICIVGHGSSRTTAVVAALRLALSASEKNIMAQLRQLVRQPEPSVPSPVEIDSPVQEQQPTTPV